MSLVYRAFYDRDINSINGAFTLQVYDPSTPDIPPRKIINRIAAVSGQRGHEGTSWHRSKSPIPFSAEVKGGKLWLWLTPMPGEIPGSPLAPAKGIGEFWPISSEEFDRTRIIGVAGQLRTHVGGHDDNMFMGTAGCVGFAKDRDTLHVSAVLHDLKRRGLDKIRLDVV